MAHDTFFVDNVRDAAGKDPKGWRNAVGLSQLAIRIAEQGKRQVVLRSKLFVRFGGIVARAEHLRPCFLKNRVAIAKSAGFAGTAGRIVFRVEIQNDAFLAEKILETGRGVRPGR